MVEVDMPLPPIINHGNLGNVSSTMVDRLQMLNQMGYHPPKSTNQDQPRSYRYL